MEKKILTREELYELVWKIPIQQLAKQFSLSDVGLAKICRKHNIPLPERGYWRRIETGKLTAKKSLPKSKSVDNKIEIICREKKRPAIIYSDALNEIIKKELAPDNKIALNDTITHKHAIRAEKNLSNSRTENDGIIFSRVKNPPPIYVSKKSLLRSLKIIDTLLVELEARGFCIKWPKEPKRYFSTTIKGTEIGFSLTEKLDRKDHIPTKEEKANQKKFSWRTWPKWDYEPSGKLTLNLITPKNLWNIKYNWSDGKIKRVENQLNEFIIEIHKITEEDKNAQEREIQWKIEAENRRIQFIEEEKERLEYKRKMEFILSTVENWKQAKIIEEFCNSLSKSTNIELLTNEQKDLYGELINLLTLHKNRINPLTSVTNLLTAFTSKYTWKY